MGYLEVCVGSDRVRIQGVMRYVATLREVGSQDRGRGSHGEAPVAAACPGGVLGFPPHLRAQCA